MALPILDGNQTATTLSTVLTSGEHIPAHTVVSLGSTAISNITSAVSGSVVSVSNFPSTQTIAGTVTANVGAIASGVTIPVRLFAEAEGGPTSGQDTLLNCDSNGQLLVNLKSGGASVLGYDGNAFVQVKQVSGSSVTIGSLPAINGTVTANLGQGLIDETGDVGSQAPRLVVGVYDVDGIQLGANKPFPISGTVTANVDFAAVPNEDCPPKAVLIGFDDSGSIVRAGTADPLPISGTVTANNPNGALTTRFGSVVTANLSQITSAVTNANRKYLLAQNISAGTVTIGIGFSPTTTQGIQLPAGGGLTFDAFCPTGAVYWLGAVTGANYCLIEG